MTDSKQTMAEALTRKPAEAVKPTPEAPAVLPRRRRRRSLIDKDPLPETKIKRTRRKKDPKMVKSYSMTVIMTQEMHDRFKALAEQQELSMNGIITRLIRKYIITHDVDLNDL